jgi:uncharacterized membrane protein
VQAHPAEDNNMAEQPNPYAAPASRVDDVASAAPRSARFIPGGKSVPAGNGWQWIASAWELFKRNPGGWILIFIIFFGILMLCSWVPFIGFVAMDVLTPILMGGVVLGCASLERGGPLEVSHLFAGFREQTGALATVGLLYLAGTLVILLVVGLIFGFSLVPIFMGAGPPETAEALTLILLASLVMLALLIPVLMAVWFASPLVVLHGLKPVDAIKTSFLGCLKNILPFLIYGVIALLLGIVATIPILLGWLVLGPVIMASVYTGYRDIFTEPAGT